MIRVHLIALPRSGTTALSKAIAERLGLQLIREPIFLWTDGFRLDLESKGGLRQHDLQRIRERLAKLSRVFQADCGFVEKTPASVFLAPVMNQVLRDSIILVITRERDEIVRSIERMIFEDQDGNIEPTANFHVHKLKRRIAKILLLFRILGVIEGIPAMIRSYGWVRRNSISTFASRERVEKYVDDAQNRLAALQAGPSNQVLTIQYDQFRSNPDMIIEQIYSFCHAAQQSVCGDPVVHQNR